MRYVAAGGLQLPSPAESGRYLSQPSTLSVRSRCSTPVERRRQATREATKPQRLRAANAKLKKRQAARDVLYLYERRDAVSLRRRRVVSHPTPLQALRGALRGALH